MKVRCPANLLHLYPRLRTMSQCDTMWHSGQALGVQSIQWLKFVRCKGTLHGISIWTKCDAIRDKHGFVIQIYTPMDCSQATSCSSDSTDTHRATHHRLIAGTQSDRMCDNTRHFYVVVQSAKKKSFQKLLTFVANNGTKQTIAIICPHELSGWLIQIIASPSFTKVERSLWQWLSIAGTIWRQNGSMINSMPFFFARCKEWRPMKHGIQMALAALSSSVLIV